MSRIPVLLFLAILVGGAHASAAEPSCDAIAADPICCDECYCPKRYFQADLLFFDWARNGSDQVAVIRVTDEANDFPGTTVLTTNDARPGVEPGVRFLLGWELDECRAVEISYLGIFNATGNATATGTNDLAIPGDLGLAAFDLFAADTIRLDSRARLHSIEANFLRRTNDCVQLLAGLRYLSLNEEFNIHGIDSDTGESDYNLKTTNNLFGVQVGGRWTETRERWSFDVTGKLGLYDNDMTQSQFVSDFPPGFFLRDPIGNASNRLAFVGDVQFNLTYFLTQTLSARIGYNLLWVEGVALASDQLDFTDTATSGNGLNSGSLFLHGVHIGIEQRW